MERSILLAALFMANFSIAAEGGSNIPLSDVKLPPVSAVGTTSLEEVLARRRSVREFAPEPLKLDEVSQLVWAAQGINSPTGRTTPSAGATYPLEVYLVVGNVGNMPAGVYRYHPDRHLLGGISAGDIRRQLATAALDQHWISDAAMIVVIAAVPERTSTRYGARAERYVYIEVGHAAQNLLLQAAALNIGATPVGAFDDAEISRLLHLQRNEAPLYIIPVGKSKP